MANIEKRTNSKGETSYRAKVRLRGHPIETATFNRLTDAKKWVQDTESAIREGRYFKHSQAKKRTLNECIDRYIKEVLPSKPKSHRDQERQLNWWKANIGAYFLADVTPSLISECKDRLVNDIPANRKRKRSLPTVNRYLAVLSHMFTIAVKEWEWIDDNPLRKVRRSAESKGRVRFLSDEERSKLLEACKQSHLHCLYPIVVLALSTGARRNEILTLKWNNIDFTRNVIILYDTKNKETRLAPLTGHALRLIKDQKKIPRIDTEYIFPSNKGDKPIFIRKAWDSAVKEAGLEDFRFHDLRHSAASYLAMNGASLAEIAEVLGHKTLQMVKRYAHLSEAHTAGVVARMNNKIFGEV